MKPGLIASLLLLVGAATALAQTPEEMLLRDAMSLGAVPETRHIEPGEVIRAYIKAGVVAQKPDSAADYVDYRRFRKPATLFGHKLVVLEEEYMTTYIGCCVDPGIGMVVEVAGDTTELDAFLVTNKCRKDQPSGPVDSMAQAGFKPEAGKSYAYVSCRVNDMKAE